MELIEKKVQIIGGKCLGIIIPRKWTNRLGIEKGTILTLQVDATFILIKFPQRVGMGGNIEYV